VEVAASATSPEQAERRPTRPRHASGWRLAAWYGIWAATNAALGVLLAYPLLLLHIIGLHARAMMLDRPDSPFSNKEIQGGEANGFIPLGIVGMTAVLLLAPALLVS
jgi:hypothetical protein